MPSTGKADDVLLGISDRMLTSDDIEFEALQTKIYLFPSGKACCLFSGDAVAQDTVFMETYRMAQEGGVVGIADLARLYAENFASLRRKRAEQIHLAPHGLTMQTFLASQNTMNSDLVWALAKSVAEEGLELHALVAGVDSQGAHIYRISDPGVEECFDGVGFCAIGSGSRQFESQFMYLGYSRHWNWLDALLLMYSAKKRAERSPGVGPQTDMWTIIASRGADLPPRYHEALEECHKELQATIEGKTKELVKRLTSDPRITGGPEGQAAAPTDHIDASAGPVSLPAPADGGEPGNV